MSKSHQKNIIYILEHLANFQAEEINCDEFNVDFNSNQNDRGFNSIYPQSIVSIANQAAILIKELSENKKEIDREIKDEKNS